MNRVKQFHFFQKMEVSGISETLITDFSIALGLLSLPEATFAVRKSVRCGPSLSWSMAARMPPTVLA